jgi:pimeloyl-ACP methyl ester carboxylesterase
MSRRSLLLLPLLALPALGPATCPSGGPGGSYVVQQYRVEPGFAEPHTPGSGVAGVEMAASENVQSILGTAPELNRVSYVRTYLARPNAQPPRAIVIFVPGFLGGGGTFTPLARQLVQKYNGNLEVWAVDRRPNQLEDRRGSAYAQGLIDAAASDDEVRDALYAGTFFYLPEDGTIDTNENGEIDPPTELPDALGNLRSYVQLEQDDVRFFAHWGVDTYVRDWKALADAARQIVGPDGVVLLGGHSQGTYWTSVFAAYDFDPDPNVVDAGYSHVDGLILLEGGGGGGGSASKPNLASYLATVASLETAGGPDVYLDDFQGINPAVLGPAAEIAGLSGIHLPDDPAIVQRTSVFGGPPFTLFFTAPFDNRSQVGFFIDDDTQPITAFRASLGFSDDGVNRLLPGGGFLGEFYFAESNADLRRWKDFDDPTLPTCPPNQRKVSPGCAIEDLGAPDDPFPATPPQFDPRWGVEAEVTSLDDVLDIQTAPSNFVEWYFGAGRPSLDGSYGVDSSALVAESVAATGSEGPLVLTQNGNVSVPVLCIGGSNGLTPRESNFASYLGSIATPAPDKEIAIVEGYAHLDLLTARDNGAVPLLVDWINRQMVRKLLAP